MNASSHRNAGRAYALFLWSIIALAGVGYLVGISLTDATAERTQRDDLLFPEVVDPAHDTSSVASDLAPIPAVNYASMRRRQSGPTARWTPGLEQIPQPKVDLFAEIKPSEADKLKSTETRGSRRAFNGAPPIIPHAVENTADAACYACHGMGMRIENRVANRMSHQFLANCTQCHAPPPPKPFSEFDANVENDFVGLPAPLKGERAFDGAPPTIPHSTWMRGQCLSCHGNQAGWEGLQSTHPWRTSCQQCHAPGASLEQGVATPSDFLSLPIVDSE